MVAAPDHPATDPIGQEIKDLLRQAHHHRLSAATADPRAPAAEEFALFTALEERIRPYLERRARQLVSRLDFHYNIAETPATIQSDMTRELYLIWLRLTTLEDVTDPVAYLLRAATRRTFETIMASRGIRRRSVNGKRTFHSIEYPVSAATLEFPSPTDIAGEVCTQNTTRQYLAALPQIAEEVLEPIDQFLFQQRLLTRPPVPYQQLVPLAQDFGHYSEENLRQRVTKLKRHLCDAFRSRGFTNPFREDQAEP